MKTLYFEVNLKTDIILNQKAVTQGANTTLDYIPGSNFLGIVASVLYTSDLESQKALDLFHNGKVRFGDAHLISPSGARSLKVPAAYYYPKGSDPCETLYISHLVPQDEQTQQKMRKIQLKQCRNGYYDFTDEGEKAVLVQCDTNFAIKSAHDRDTRTSKEKAMYGYESLQAGTKMLFEVQIDESVSCLESDIIDALTKGHSKRVGRSRSAQFGLLEIRQLDKAYRQVSGNSGKGTVIVYADSRLIFLDEISGLPTFQPTAKQLGLDGTINWEKSQIRTFQYAPWNFKRQCFDTDRCGLEKGSVIVIENVSIESPASSVVGSYKNEGFGHVLFNPSFLSGDKTTGLSSWKLQKLENTNNKSIESNQELTITLEDRGLLYLLKRAHNRELYENRIFQLVNTWKQKNADRFKSDDSFASQWGTIRSIATRRLLGDSENLTANTLQDELFADKIGYLRHGVAQSKWEERKRIQSLQNFLKYDLINFPDEETQCLAIINLAAEMSKIYRKRKEDRQ